MYMYIYVYMYVFVCATCTDTIYICVYRAPLPRAAQEDDLRDHGQRRRRNSQSLEERSYRDLDAWQGEPTQTSTAIGDLLGNTGPYWALFVEVAPLAYVLNPYIQRRRGWMVQATPTGNNDGVPQTGAPKILSAALNN